MLTLATAPAAVLTTAEAKAHLRISHSLEDTLIASLVSAATAYLDGYSGILGRALVTQVWDYTLPCFASPLRLPMAPVSAISYVKYLDDDAVEQTVSSADYYLSGDASGPYIALVDGADWPTTYPQDNAVSVRFTAGYGAASAVPAAIKQAMLLLVGHWYENRSALGANTLAELPLAVGALLAPYRRVGF